MPGGEKYHALTCYIIIITRPRSILFQIQWPKMSATVDLDHKLWCRAQVLEEEWAVDVEVLP